MNSEVPEHFSFQYCEILLFDFQHPAIFALKISFATLGSQKLVYKNEVCKKFYYSDYIDFLLLRNICTKYAANRRTAKAGGWNSN
jgi:hypothetical protein